MIFFWKILLMKKYDISVDNIETVLPRFHRDWLWNAISLLFHYHLCDSFYYCGTIPYHNPFPNIYNERKLVWDIMHIWYAIITLNYYAINFIRHRVFWKRNNFDENKMVNELKYAKNEIKYFEKYTGFVGMIMAKMIGFKVVTNIMLVVHTMETFALKLRYWKIY